MRNTIQLVAVGFSVALLSACGSGGDSASGPSEDADSWTGVTEAACAEGAAATDHEAVIRERLGEERYEELSAAAAPFQPTGMTEYLSCGGEAPFSRRFESETARQVWENDELADGCTGIAVAGTDWVVTQIPNATLADSLVQLGGELRNC